MAPLSSLVALLSWTSSAVFLKESTTVVEGSPQLFTIPLTHRWKSNPEKARPFIEKLHRHQNKYRPAEARFSETAAPPVSLALLNEESFFSGRVEIGKPKAGEEPQYFNVVMDTGSDYLVFPSIYCETELCQNSNQFDPSKSETYESQTPDWLKKKGEYRSLYVQFGSGSVMAVIGQDNVELAGVKIPHMKFGQIIEDTLTLGPVHNLEGILGFGSLVQPPKAAGATTDSTHPRFRQGKQHLWRDPDYTAVHETDETLLQTEGDPKEADHPDEAEMDDSQLSVMTSIVNSKVLTSNVFSFFFSRKPEVDGSFTIGGSDPQLHQGELTYVPVVDSDPSEKDIYWRVKVDDIKVNGQSLNLCAAKDCSAIIDTGTTFMLAPDTFTTALLDKLGVSPACTNVKSLPRMSIVMSGNEFHLDPADYLIADTARKVAYDSKNAKDISIDMPHMEETAMCAVGLGSHSSMSKDFFASRSYGHLFTGVPGNLDAHAGAHAGDQEEETADPMHDTLILGSVFLRRYLSVFDVDKRRVGFAEAVHPAGDTQEDVVNLVAKLNLEIKQDVSDREGAAGGGPGSKKLLPI